MRTRVQRSGEVVRPAGATHEAGRWLGENSAGPRGVEGSLRVARSCAEGGRKMQGGSAARSWVGKPKERIARVQK